MKRPTAESRFDFGERVEFESSLDIDVLTVRISGCGVSCEVTLARFWWYSIQSRRTGWHTYAMQVASMTARGDAGTKDEDGAAVSHARKTGLRIILYLHWGCDDDATLLTRALAPCDALASPSCTP